MTDYEQQKKILEIIREKERKDNAPVWRMIKHTHKREAEVISYYDINARPYFYREILDISGLEGFETGSFKETAKSKEKPYIYPIINGDPRTEYKNELRPKEFIKNDEKRLNCRVCYNLVPYRKGQDWAGRKECVSCYSSHRKNRDSAIQPVKII